MNSSRKMTLSRGQIADLDLCVKSNADHFKYDGKSAIISSEGSIVDRTSSTKTVKFSNKTFSMMISIKNCTCSR